MSSLSEDSRKLGMQSGVDLCALLFAALLFGNVATIKCCIFQPDVSVQCETVDSSVCGLHFNSTSFPNAIGHQNQEQAQQFLHETSLLRLETLNCSEYTRLLICATVFPLCYRRRFERVEPCREMCVAVRESCRESLRSRSLDWPTSLNCDMFAPYGTQLCIWNDSSSCSFPSTIGKPNPPPPTTEVGAIDNRMVPSSAGPTCVGHLSPVNNSRAVFGGIERCTEPCRGTYFEDDQARLIMVWTTAISFLSLIVAILVFFTLLLNYKTIHSLEVSVYYITLCYGILAFTNLLSVVVGGDKIVCNDSIQNSYNNQSILLVDGLTDPVCSMFFSLGYYFTLCTWCWWLMLALEWSVCAFRSTNVSSEWRALFHALAWGTPFVFLLFSLFTRSFSGNSVLQTCWISKHHELGFVLVPLSGTITLCSVLIVVTFARVVNLRNKEFMRMYEGSAPVDAPNSVDPSLLNKTGTYVVFYLIPMGLLLCTYFYDYWFRDAWEATYHTCSTSSPSLQNCDMVPSSAKPSVQVYMARVFVSICMGFISVFWLLRPKLLLAWRKLCCALCIFSMQQYGEKPPPVLPPPKLPSPRQQRLRLEPISIQMQLPSPLESEV